MEGLRGLVATVLLLPALCAAAIEFPRLTGRVVDNAGMLESVTERALSEQLAAHEQATTNQVVVVTLPDLQGYTIEEFGYQLGRHWSIGQKDKNNGVLLLVAPSERAVRIEVGYGLEGELTDALASRIIHGVILPQFKRGRFENGITEGVTAIIAVLGGETASLPEVQEADGTKVRPLMILLVILIILFGPARNSFFGSYGGRSGGFRSGGGGGFRGGGGSFGGGGASGRW
jgi:uncharacterized protein